MKQEISLHLTKIMKHSLLMFFILLSTTLFSQRNIYGYIQDSSSGERIVGAYIKVYGENTSTTSNNFGYFSLNTSLDSCLIMISSQGFDNQAVLVLPGYELPVMVSMVQATTFKGVTVKAKKDDKVVTSTQMSSVSVTMAQVKMLPRFFGETDIIKAIQLMPGIKGGSEGSSGLYVRGGGPDQNLILLDGAPVYNVNHLFGFFSIFNSDAINHVQLLKGGFPARYGGRLSSVLDVTMKEGNMMKYKVEGSVGALASKIAIEGPIVKNKASFMVCARRTYLDFLMQPIFRLANGNSNLSQGYFFSDINAKVNWKLNSKNRIYLSYYTGKDKYYVKSKPYTYLYDGNTFSDESEDRNQWGNRLGALRWNTVLNKKLFINTQVNYTRYYYEIVQSAKRSETNDTGGFEQSNYNSFLSGIRDYTLRSDAEWNMGKHYLRFGLSSVIHQFEPGSSTVKYSETGQKSIDTTYGSGKVNSFEQVLYAEDDYEFNSKLKFNYGVHFNLYSYKKHFFPSIQPRLSVRYMLGKNWSAKMAYSNMRQNIHLLTSNNLGLPTDLWVPATNIVKPLSSNQIAAGIARNLGDKFELTFESYYKKMKNVIEYKEGASFLNVNSSWENKVTPGYGESYGFEWLLQKKAGNLTGWVGYTLSWAKRNVPEVNFGKTFYYKYDSRHDFSFVLNYKENEKWDYGLVWVFRTGNAITMPTVAYPSMNTPGWSNPSNPAYGYDGRNNFRFADYHRLDLSVTRHIKKKWGLIDINFSIYNAYSRINPFYYTIGTDYRGNKQVKRVGLFPILPSINIAFKL